MNKQEIVSYLTGLLALMEAQDTSGVHNRSQVLGDEYNKHWNLLKAMITAEQADETRKRDIISHGSDQTRHLSETYQPGLRRTDWDSPGRTEGGGADDNGQGSAGSNQSKHDN